MVKLSALSAGALFALRYLAELDRPATASEIARFGRLPGAVMSKTLMLLKKAGFIYWVKGRGYRLYQAPGEISAFEVVQAVEPTPSSSRHCGMDYETCAFREVCPLSPLCRDIYDLTLRSLKSFTVADLGGRLESGPPYTEGTRKRCRKQRRQN